MIHGKSRLWHGMTPGVKGPGMAFTLVELLVAVAFILILGGVLLQTSFKLSAPTMTGPVLGYNGGFAGIGIALEEDEKSGAVRIANIVPDSPAALAKLSPGLVIEEVDGVTTHGKSVLECQMRLRGTIGTSIRLKLARSDGKDTCVVELTRQALITSKGT